MAPPGRVGPGRIRTWMQASRAFTLGMPFMSVTVGSFLAFYVGAGFTPAKYLAAAAAAMLLQAAANLINDYYDFVKGTDVDNWQSPDAFGPGLVIQQGLITPRQIHVAHRSSRTTISSRGPPENPAIVGVAIDLTTHPWRA